MARNNKIDFGQRKSPKKVIYIACEGGSTGTEGTYIKDLCKKYNCVPQFIYKGSADPATLSNVAVSFSSKNPKRSGENFEIWIVFDNDDIKSVKAAFARVDGYNRFLQKNCVPVNIAFNSPCIEVWGMLCCGKKPKVSTAAVMQGLLKNEMPSYHHERSPRFDFDKMEEGYEEALKIAVAWKNSLGDSPEYSAALFAGIYKLVQSINNI